MYTSPDEARSDLFLAGAVYLFGPLILQILFRIVPVAEVPVLGLVVGILLPLVTTILVPLLLIRYRRERLGEYGFAGGAQGAVAIGLLLALPFVVARALAILGAGVSPVDDVPLLVEGPAEALALLERLMRWVGLVGLALYATVKARDAFRADVRRLREGVVETARYVGIAAGVATALLLLGGVFDGLRWEFVLELVLQPLGLAAAIALALRALGGPSATTRATLLAPVVLLALGPFTLTLNAQNLLVGLWRAALYGGIGLLVAAQLESRRSAYGALALGVAVAALTQL